MSLSSVRQGTSRTTRRRATSATRSSRATRRPPAVGHRSPRGWHHGGMRPIVAGIGISHPDRVLFPDAGATKLDLARYYEAIAGWILPHLVDRPLTLVRCPTGVRANY